MKTVDEMLVRLRAQPNVAGVIRYGSDHADEAYSVGDVDLFAVLYKEPPVESLHFDVGLVPVDLSRITLERLAALRPTFTFPRLALRDGSVVFDKTGEVARALERLKARFSSFRPEALSEHTVAFTRHGHWHVLDKLRGRLKDEPLMANLLLGANAYWLSESYFRVRGLPFGGSGRRSPTSERTTPRCMPYSRRFTAQAPFLKGSAHQKAHRTRARARRWGVAAR